MQKDIWSVEGKETHQARLAAVVQIQQVTVQSYVLICSNLDRSIRLLGYDLTWREFEVCEEAEWGNADSGD